MKKPATNLDVLRAIVAALVCWIIHSRRGLWSTETHRIECVGGSFQIQNVTTCMACKQIVDVQSRMEISA